VAVDSPSPHHGWGEAPILKFRPSFRYDSTHISNQNDTNTHDKAVDPAPVIVPAPSPVAAGARGLAFGIHQV